MEKKLTIAVLFGGQSSEHDISCMSVINVAAALDPDRYHVQLIGITKEGKWLKVDGISAIADGSWEKGRTQAIISPDATDKAILYVDGGQVRKVPIDAAFPVLHGLYGEDGTVQGLFELAGIPYVGCGVLASAVSMDKTYTKLIVERLGIAQARYAVIQGHELKADTDACIRRVEETLAYPVFVKPSRAGSSQGVSKAADREALIAALDVAVQHDSRILVEETIVGREIECAVLGGVHAAASGVGEILSADDQLYSFDAKYHNPDSQTQIRPDLPEEAREEVRRDALAIFAAVDGYGLSRVDFFLEKGTGRVVFNEINTMPGFTGISMYPMLWADQGVDKTELLGRLIDLAIERGARP